MLTRDSTTQRISTHLCKSVHNLKMQLFKFVQENNIFIKEIFLNCWKLNSFVQEGLVLEAAVLS